VLCGWFLRLGPQIGDEDACKGFWQSALSESWGRLHPAQGDPDRTVPVLLHGDEGKYSKGRSIMVLSWGTPLVHGVSMETRFPITVLPSRLMYCVGHQYVTLDQLQAFLASSFDKAFRERVCTFRAAYMGVKGDWKFHVQLRPDFGRSAAADLICFDCMASQSVPGLLYTDVGPNAGWIATIQEQGDNLPPLAATPGWHWNSYFADVLHTVWLGVGRDAVGSWCPFQISVYALSVN